MKIQAVHYGKRGGALADTKAFGIESARRARAFHAGFSEYSPTPLTALPGLAAHLGLGALYIKDESHRFGLNAFKVLGGSYAIGNILAQRLGQPLADLSFGQLASPAVRQKVGTLTFVTATDGNHGRGVAWTARRLGHRAVVYMPKGSAAERLENIRALGAEASITDMNYDDTACFARTQAEKHGWVTVQDTAWPGYEQIPTWIMQGYTTMALETVEQLTRADAPPPTHVFLQAGVGALAGGITGFFADLYGSEGRPIITIVEPDRAACIFKTAQAGDGGLHAVTGNLDTIMAGLACGVPCSVGWRVMQDHADNFISCPDEVAAKGMRVLGSPLPGDPRVVSGESGAATLGLVAQVMQDPGLAWLREQLRLDGGSRVLCFSTEGDTDRENYRRIVWDGMYPSV